MSFLRDFFAREVDFDDGMGLFGSLHIGLSLFFLILYAAVILFRGELRRFGHFKAVRYATGAVLSANMLIHYTGRIIIGEWRFSEDLPLHICFMANFFLIYILFTNNKGSLFSVIYYFTMIGPLPAAVFPDISRTWSGYLFYQFIISHHVMMLCGLYCAFVLEYETAPRSAVRAFVFGNSYVAAMAVFNRIFGTNYIMLGQLPEQLYRFFPFLNTMPAVFWLELVGIAALAAAYFLWAATEKHPPLGKRREHIG